MLMFNDIIWCTRDNEQECIANATLVSLFAKRFPAGRWSFFGLGSEKKWFLLTSIDHEENGTESMNWWWSNSQKADTQFLEPRVHCPDKRSEAKEVDNYRYTSVPMEIWFKLFFAQLFLVISSVFTEQSQICVRNTVLVKQERGDPCWQDNLTHCSSQQNYWKRHLHFRLKFPLKKIYCKVPGTSGKAITTKLCDKDVYWCMIPENSWSRTVFHDKGRWRVLTMYRTSDMSWVHMAKRWKIIWPERLDSREHQNWARVRSHKQLHAR